MFSLSEIFFSSFFSWSVSVLSSLPATLQKKKKQKCIVLKRKIVHFSPYRFLKTINYFWKQMRRVHHLTKSKVIMSDASEENRNCLSTHSVMNLYNWRKSYFLETVRNRLYPGAWHLIRYLRTTHSNIQ